MNARPGPSNMGNYYRDIAGITSSDGKTESSRNEKHYKFESLMDIESSAEESIDDPSTSTNFKCQIPMKTSEENTRSSETGHFSDSSDEGIYVPIGLPQSTTTTIGVERRVGPQKQLSDGLSSETDHEEIVLSIIYQNGHLGAAYYNTVTSELYVLEDIAESSLNFDMTNVLYRQSRPSFIITTSGLPEQFITQLKKLIINASENTSNETLNTDNRFTRLRFKIMSKREYSSFSCLIRVQHLKLECEPEDSSDEDRVLFLSSIINFNSTIMVHALGLLLKYLDKHWNAMALEAIGQAKFVQLHKLNLKNIVMVDHETYKGLQIVNPRYHPSLFKFGTAGSCREGLSLYNLLNRCQSRPGVQFLWKVLFYNVSEYTSRACFEFSCLRRKCNEKLITDKIEQLMASDLHFWLLLFRLMFQHPTNDVKLINKRLDVIEFFLDPKNQNIAQNILPCLSKIHQITKVMNRLSAPQVKASEWQRLHKTLCNIIQVVDICGVCKDKLPIFEEIVDSATDEMHRLRYFIEYIVDFESTRRQNKFVAHSGVDPELDQLNYENQTLPQVLSIMAERDLQTLPQCVKACSMAYLPDIGYLLAITEWEGEPPMDNELPGLEFKFVANNIYHYKSPGAIELQNSFGDVQEKITKRQSQIMLQLVQYIIKHIKPVIEIIKHIAKLDALLSLSAVARDSNYVRPKISKSKVIDIKQGRHPLLEAINTSSIANDTFSGEEKSLIKIITGPNASGKSVYLKQVALIIFMAHIGSYVPADSATIGIVTHILTRIHFADTMACNASSFMVDLRQMNRAISDATTNSLVMIDEFGKGTSYVDALALLAAYLTDFINRGAECPHMFVSTHIHDLINWIPQSPIVEKQTFEFLIGEDKSVIYLYKLISCSSDISFAHSVAAAAGLDQKVVQRALSIYEAKKKDKRIAKLEMLNVCHREKLCEKICKHLAEVKQNVDMDGLKSCVTQMWQQDFVKKPLDSDTS